MIETLCAYYLAGSLAGRAYIFYDETYHLGDIVTLN